MIERWLKVGEPLTTLEVNKQQKPPAGGFSVS
jgi:hypothetical protein